MARQEEQQQYKLLATCSTVVDNGNSHSSNISVSNNELIVVVEVDLAL